MTIHDSLVELGYYIRYAVLDAKEYGNVPQTRKRVFIVAFLDLDKCQRFKYPEPIERTIGLNDIILSVCCKPFTEFFIFTAKP